jgi:hypothetical protein
MTTAQARASEAAMQLAPQQLCTHVAGHFAGAPDLVHSREGAHGVGHIVGAVRERHDARREDLQGMRVMAVI